MRTGGETGLTIPAKTWAAWRAYTFDCQRGRGAAPCGYGRSTDDQDRIRDAVGSVP